MHKIKRLLEADKTFWIIIGIFLIQAFIFAVSINRGIPPDEDYHVGFIQYYSQQPVMDGPFIDQQTSQSLRLGDIQRAPSYLYHYLLGNIAKIFHVFTSSEAALTYLMRFLNIGLVVLGLVVLRKLFNEIKVKKIHQNLTFIVLALTTMFVGVSAAVNYDNAIFLIVNLFLLELIRFIKRRSAIDFMLLVVVGALGMLVKYAFSTIIAAAFIILLVQIVKDRKILIDLKNSFKLIFKQQKLLSIGLLLLLVLSLGLFTERYVMNAAQYKAITPVCTKLHTETECRMNIIYRRDADQKATFDKFIQEGGKVIYNPFGFVGNWISQMYEGLFFYLGQVSIYPSYRLKNLTAVFFLISFVIILIYYRRGSVLTGPEDKIIAFVVIFYGLALFMHNLNAYLNSASFYGFQGRYLIPVAPFLFLFFIRALFSSCETLIKNGHKKLVYGFIMSALILGYLHMPALVLYRGLDNAWSPGPTRSLNAKIQTILTELKIAQKGSLPNSTTVSQ